MLFEEELLAALEAANIAGAMIRREYETFVAIPDAPITISTEVDRLSQEMILQHLHDRFPDDALCAEENTPTLRSAKHHGKRTWVVDPIDGTRGFAMKNGEFSVMIGLTVDSQVVLGVVLEPAHQRITYAAKGHGCWTAVGDAAPARCWVSTQNDLSKATLIQSHFKPTSVNRPLEMLKPARRIWTYSAGVKLAFVARGEADLYVNDYANFHDWDICAGQFLVEEAGGIVSELHGDPIIYGTTNFVQDGGLLGTNGLLHAEVVEKLRDLVLHSN